VAADQSINFAVGWCNSLVSMYRARNALQCSPSSPDLNTFWLELQQRTTSCPPKPVSCATIMYGVIVVATVRPTAVALVRACYRSATWWAAGLQRLWCCKHRPVFTAPQLPNPTTSKPPIEITVQTLPIYYRRILHPQEWNSGRRTRHVQDGCTDSRTQCTLGSEIERARNRTAPPAPSTSRLVYLTNQPHQKKKPAQQYTTTVLVLASGCNQPCCATLQTAGES
jgi:hypothetical protein